MTAAVALGFGVQGAAGFGAGLVCVTLGAQVMPITEVVPLVVPLSLGQTSWLLWRDRAHVARPLLFRRVLPWMGAGMALGLGVYALVGADELLKRIYGLLLLALSLRELWRLHRGHTEPVAVARPVAHGAMLVAGLLHGLYGTGGPALVYALGHELPDRRAFRATLCAVWFGLNLVLLGVFLTGGRLAAPQLALLPGLFVAMGLGTLAGNQVHDRISPAQFRWGVFGLLALSSLPLVLR